MEKNNEKLKELERILNGKDSVVLELSSSKENIIALKKNLEELDYEIYDELKSKNQKIYHFYIKKFSDYQND